MIQPLRSSAQLAFKGDVQQEKPTMHRRVANFLQGVNTVTGTTQGFARGAAEGVGAMALIALVGKNVKNSKGNIYQTIIGITKDSAKAVKTVLKQVPAIITEAPIKNAKKLLNVPKNFYGNYLKGNKLVGAIATLGGLGILALRTIQGKMNANQNNAEIEHRFGLTHKA